MQDPSEARSRSVRCGTAVGPSSPRRLIADETMRACDNFLGKALSSATHAHDAFGRALAVHKIAFLSVSRGADEDRTLLVPRQHCIHPGDERSELLDVLPEELLGRLVGDPPVLRDQSALELNVRLDGIHQR